MAPMAESLGNFEKLLLLALARLDDAYGVTVRQEIAGRTGREVAAGAVYTGLERLEARGMVTSELGEPTPVRGGRRKRHYRLLPAGEKALATSFEELRLMSAGLPRRLRLS